MSTRTPWLDGLRLAPGPTASMLFRQAEASVSFATNADAARRHATETLYAYRREPAGPAPWQIRVHRTEVSGAPAAFPEGTDLEIGPRLHARVRPAPDGEAYWVPGHQTLIHAERIRRIITAYCGTAEAAVYWAARLVRQAMTAQLLDVGAVYAHTAALALRGHGIVIGGHRGAGKTTTLLAALRYLGGDYVTNDRLLLRACSGDVVGYPWPAHLRAGIGTLSALPHLTGLVPTGLRGLTPQQRRSYPRKVAIEPPDFPRLTENGDVATTVRPTLMIWPRLDFSRRTSDVQPVPADEVKSELLATRLFMTDPGRGASAHINHWLIPAPPHRTTTDHVRRVASALADLPCYRVQAGTDPKHLAHRIREVLQQKPVSDA